MEKNLSESYFSLSDTQRNVIDVVNTPNISPRSRNYQRTLKILRDMKPKELEETLFHMLNFPPNTAKSVKNQFLEALRSRKTSDLPKDVDLDVSSAEWDDLLPFRELASAVNHNLFSKLLTELKQTTKGNTNNFVRNLEQLQASRSGSALRGHQIFGTRFGKRPIHVVDDTVSTQANFKSAKSIAEMTDNNMKSLEGSISNSSKKGGRPAQSALDDFEDIDEGATLNTQGKAKLKGLLDEVNNTIKEIDLWDADGFLDMQFLRRQPGMKSKLRRLVEARRNLIQFIEEHTFKTAKQRKKDTFNVFVDSNIGLLLSATSTHARVLEGNMLQQSIMFGGEVDC